MFINFSLIFCSGKVTKLFEIGKLETIFDSKKIYYIPAFKFAENKEVYILLKDFCHFNLLSNNKCCKFQLPWRKTLFLFR